jgi:succinate dehydrogenase flavin-adding protein (antitoxin of CptAB toxin-antitoxin module)
VAGGVKVNVVADGLNLSVVIDQLLDEPDWDIYYWSIEKREPPPRWKGTKLLEE